MSWTSAAVALLVLVGLYLAFKLVGVVFKLLMWVLVLVGAYWFLAPHLGWPSLSDVVYVLGPDFGGRRIEQVVQPSEIAGEVTERVVDGVLERVDPTQPAEEPAQPASDLPHPEPLPEADPTDARGQAENDENAPVR
jgi:hypothetical protein